MEKEKKRANRTIMGMPAALPGDQPLEGTPEADPVEDVRSLMREGMPGEPAPSAWTAEEQPKARREAWSTYDALRGTSWGARFLTMVRAGLQTTSSLTRRGYVYWRNLFWGLPKPFRWLVGGMLAVWLTMFVVVLGLLVVLAFRETHEASVVLSEGGSAIVVELETNDVAELRIWGRKAKLQGEKDKANARGEEKEPDKVSAILLLDERDLAREDLQKNGGASVDVVWKTQDGSTMQETFHVDAPHLVVWDRSELASASPVLRLRTRVQPGVSVKVNGKSLDADEDGLAQFAFPLSAANLQNDMLEGNVQPRRVEADVELGADGTTVKQRLVGEAPVTPLSLRRPGVREVVAEADSLRLSGEVSRGSSVTLQGEPMLLAEGRVFEKDVPIAGFEKQTLSVVATLARHLPAQVDIEVLRVRSWLREARQVSDAGDIDYVKAMKEPVSQKGKKVSFAGKVFHVSSNEARASFQMELKACPKDDACALWINHAGVRSFALGDMVHVIGTLDGRQRFRDERGTVQQIPRVHAMYTLPLEAPRPKRNRRR